MAKAKVKQKQINKGIENYFDNNPEALDNVAEDVAKEATKPVKIEELKAQLKDAGVKVGEAERVSEKVLANREAFLNLDKSAQLEQMKSLIANKRSTSDFKKEQYKWWEGNQSQNLQRMALGQDRTTMAEKIMSEFTNQLVSRGMHNQLWPTIAKNLEKKGYDEASEVVKSGLEAGDLSAGGATIPEAVAEELIEFNFPNAPVREFDVNIVDVSSGSMRVPKFAGRTQSGWGGELTAANNSSPDFENRYLDAKKLTILTPISNDLLRRAVQGLEAQLIRHLQRSIGVDETLAALRGSGSDGEPTGIKNQIDAGNVFDRKGSAGSTATAENILQTIGAAKNAVDDSNLNNDSAGWIMTDRTVNGIMFQDVSDGIYPTVVMQLMDGELINRPVRTTNALPKNLDASGQATDDETEIYYGVWDQLWVGDTLNMEVMVENGKAYVEGGSVKSALARDESVAKITHEVDFAVAYDKAFSVVEGVDFGADAFS